jgi:hypothetical protein
MLDSGELLRLIEEDGVSGVTSNPAILAGYPYFMIDMQSGTNATG